MIAYQISVGIKNFLVQNDQLSGQADETATSYCYINSQNNRTVQASGMQFSD
jgi:hypothetical protein